MTRLSAEVQALADRVSGHLARRPAAAVQSAVGPSAVREAAVAIVLFDGETGPRYCLIKRALRGRNAGQWALPGGRLEPGESPLDAALRESREEVGLPSCGVEVLGRLDPLSTRTGFVVSPFVVAVGAGWVPTVASDEVQRVVEFDAERLADPEAIVWVTVDEGPALLRVFASPEVRVHAPTGAFLWQFGQLGLQGRDVSVQGLRQPDFTRR